MYGSSKRSQPSTLVWRPVSSHPPISWVTFEMKSGKICCQTLTQFHHLQPGRSKRQHSTVRSNTFGNLHSHYTPYAPQQHASKSRTKSHVLLASVMWWNPVYACLAKVILLDITWAIENLRACGGVLWPTSFSSCTSCKKGRARSHTAAGGKWTLSQVLIELYVGITWDRKNKGFDFKTSTSLTHSLTCSGKGD